MKSIGEQAKTFREAKGWSYTRMAAEVSKHASAPVSRHAITQLEEAGFRKPHYIVALAAVMGVSTDALLTGSTQKYQPPHDVATPVSPTLGQILEALSDQMLTMTDSTRHRAGLLLASLADNPESHAEIAAMLGAAEQKKAPVYATAAEANSQSLIELSENFKIERRKAVRPRRREG